MISAATGAMALSMVTLVKDHGLHYLLAATLLIGVLQTIAGYLKLGGLMSFVSRSVVTGFVNALAILIFIAQLPELTHVTWHVYAMTAGGLVIIYLFPYIPVIGKSLPSPLVCIVALTAIALYLLLDIRTVGDMGGGARHTAGFPLAGRAIDLGNLTDHFSLFGRIGGSRFAGIADDRHYRQ